jgi:hypothetical protein
VSKKRKDGAPRKKPTKARIGTPTREVSKKLPSPLDNATIFDLQQLVADAPPELESIAFTHRVPRPGDPPGANLERMTVFDRSTEQTKHYVRRKGEHTWYFEDNAAKQQRK